MVERELPSERKDKALCDLIRSCTDAEVYNFAMMQALGTDTLGAVLNGRCFFRFINPDRSLGGFIDSSSDVDITAYVSSTAVIDASHVGADAVISPMAEVWRGSFIGDGAVLGESVIVEDGGSVMEGASIGARSIVKSNVIVRAGAVVPEDTVVDHTLAAGL